MTDNDDELPERNDDEAQGKDDEESRRKLDFILEQQAQFASDAEHMKEAAARITGVIERLTNVLSTLADSQIRTEKNMSALIDNMTKLIEAQAQLAESQAHTDRRLDALIDVIREDRDDDDEKIN
ncbi:MAG TPA: hypothetical protein VD861_08135 [Pyrinomonadaceae bacterium]|nr:hypothetical protein [Pyrinomonadaceae bacterium]